MGYACPVCGDPQADARHLANHLAFTAMLGREDHERWLAAHAPGWADEGERELADRVAERAAEAEYPRVFEDTTGRLDSDADDERGERSGALFADEGHDGDHDHLPRGRDDGHDSHGASGGHDGRAHGAGGRAHEVADVPRDPETEAILEEARELTREMSEEGETVDVPEDDEGDDGRTGDDGTRSGDGGGRPADGDRGA